MEVALQSSFELLTNEAEAAIGLNPHFRWAKFVLTDDDVNLNLQKIPQEEFDNLIATGVFTPLKMDFGKISDGHRAAERKPLGVITNLKKEQQNEKASLIALAALWQKERPEDVELLKRMIEEGNPPKVSWEVSYRDSEYQGDIEILRGVVLTGAAIVANPAYADRTKFLAVASLETESEKWTREYINDLPDSAFLYIEDGGEKDEENKTTPRRLRHLPYRDKEGRIDPEHLRNAIARLSQQNTGKTWLTEELRQRLLEKARRLLDTYNKEENSEMEETLEEKLVALQVENERLKKELEELQAYKEAVEREKASASRIRQIKSYFEAKGLEKPDSYFEENKDLLLSLSDSALEFMVQELVSFAENMKEKKEATSSLPNINEYNDETKPNSIKELARKLREITK